MSSLGISDLLDNVRATYQSASVHVTWGFVATYGVIVLMTWLFYKAFLEQLFSPLRSLPSMPFHPVLGNMRELIRGEAMEATIRMMKEYGNLVRYFFLFGRERVMVSDPDIMKHILVTNSKNYIKPPGRLQLMRILLGEGLVMLEGPTHAAHKRLMSPFFNNHSVKKMVPVLLRRSEKLANHWVKKILAGGGDTKNTVEVAVQNDIGSTTLDIVGEVAFGYDFNSLEEPTLAINVAFQRILTGAGFSWRFAIPYYHLLPVPDVNNFHADCHLMRNSVAEVIENKRALLKKGAGEEDVAGDVLGQMLLARDEDGNSLSNEELQAEVMTLMLAGHETTAVGVSWCLLLLAQNPVIQDRAREEVMRILPQKTEDITWDHLDQLNYISCIVKETLRLLPPVPMTLRQSVGPDHLHCKEDDTQHYIPSGTILLLATGPMMRRQDLFDSPNEFVPERFLDSDTEQNFYKYLPFLIGHRMCIGYKFALLEMRTMLALILRKMHFETLPGVHYKRQSRVTMRPSPALKLMVKTV